LRSLTVNLTVNVDFGEWTADAFGAANGDRVFFDEDDAEAKGLLGGCVFRFVERSFERVDGFRVDASAESNVVAIERWFCPWPWQDTEWAFECGKDRIVCMFVSALHPHTDVNQVLGGGAEFAGTVAAFDVAGDVGDVIA
jgi:hypothetical protein